MEPEDIADRRLEGPSRRDSSPPFRLSTVIRARAAGPRSRSDRRKATSPTPTRRQCEPRSQRPDPGGHSQPLARGRRSLDPRRDRLDRGAPHFHKQSPRRRSTPLEGHARARLSRQDPRRERTENFWRRRRPLVRIGRLDGAVLPGQSGEDRRHLKDSRADQQGLSDALMKLCKARLAPYQHPRRIHFVAELPKTATGKIRVSARAPSA